MASLTVETSRYAADALLRDGRSVHIRAIRPEDKERLREHFRSLGQESVYNRFFGPKLDLTDAELRQFTELDFERQVGLFAVRRHEGREEVLGVARYAVLEEGGPRRAEMAVAVSDQHQGRGIGTVLLEHLARIALAHGIRRFEADVLGGNDRMLRMLRHSGLPIEGSVGGGVRHFSLGTEETEEFRQASDMRATSAAAESVRRLLNPHSVAVVADPRDPASVGAALVGNLKRQGFRGSIYPVTPFLREVDGLAAYPSLEVVPTAVDLVVVALDAPAVEAAVAQSARGGAAGVVVISPGFAEASPEGKEIQDRLRLLARESGMRLVGPNCMGIVNTDPAVSLNATFAPVSFVPGNVAFLSQSGALGVAILENARARGIGISSFVSVGNKADVSGNDLLAYWKDDRRTDVIALYLESFGNPRRFARLAPEVARSKPIVAVKSGRSAAGQRAATSHSAALACPDVAVDALFEQAGVIRTDTLEDLFDVVALLATQPIPKGPRVGVVTDSGGLGILFADACEARGLVLPELAPQTVAALQHLPPARADARNPVDLVASTRPGDYARTITAVGSDPGIDSVVVIHVPPASTRLADVAQAIARGGAAVPLEKPVLSVLLSSGGAPPPAGTGPRGPIPSFTFPENAARALAAAERYGRWRARPRGVLFRLEPHAAEAVRAVVARSLEAEKREHWLAPEDVHAILASIGIRTAEAPRPSDAAVLAPGEPLRQHGLGLERALDHAMREGIEALLGVRDDPLFGPLVVCGLGGGPGELLRDASFRLPPISDRDAAEMVDGLRLKALLDGHRGSPRGDRAALEAMIQQVSALAEAMPELRELAFDPVRVLPPGQGAVVFDAQIRVGPAREQGRGA